MTVCLYAMHRNACTRERVRAHATPTLPQHSLKPSSVEICTGFRSLRILCYRYLHVRVFGMGQYFVGS